MAPTPLPQRNTLVAQSTAFLRAEIAAGRWQEWLPTERALCRLLQISRNTLRSALGELKLEGSIEAVHGTGNRIVRRSRRRPAPRQAADAGLLTPVPIEQLRPTVALWIDELRALLGERDCRLHVIHGANFYRARPDSALKRLIRMNPHRCWILTLAGEAVQRWFAAHGIRCVVAGTAHAGVPLTSVDVDHEAMTRHAVGELSRLGHRRIALVIPRARTGGDLTTRRVFLDASSWSRHPDARPLLVTHDSTPEGIRIEVQRVMRRPDRPTAVIVSNAVHYLAVVSRLARLGLRIPRDVSVLSRDEDPFLPFLDPSPARYSVRPQAFARKLLPVVMGLLGDSPRGPVCVRITPDFNRGDSLGPPPAASTGPAREPSPAG